MRNSPGWNQPEPASILPRAYNPNAGTPCDPHGRDRRPTVPPDPPIPVIDLFAGPGGLGEGFSALGQPEGRPRFSVQLSIEKDAIAHQTLELRAFFRQFPHGGAPKIYYDYVRGQVTRLELYR